MPLALVLILTSTFVTAHAAGGNDLTASLLKKGEAYQPIDHGQSSTGTSAPSPNNDQSPILPMLKQDQFDRQLEEAENGLTYSWPHNNPVPELCYLKDANVTAIRGRLVGNANSNVLITTMDTVERMHKDGAVLPGIVGDRRKRVSVRINGIYYPITRMLVVESRRGMTLAILKFDKDGGQP